MVLSDRDIKAEMTAGRIVIEPLDMEDVQPASVDVRLGSSFRVFRNSTHAYIDPTLPQPDLTEEVVVPEGGQFVLHPGQFVLGTTLERMSSPAERPYGSAGLGSHYQGQRGAAAAHTLTR